MIYCRCEISTTRWCYNQGKCLLAYNCHILYRTFKNLISTRSLNLYFCPPFFFLKFAKCRKPTFSNSSYTIHRFAQNFAHSICAPSWQKLVKRILIFQTILKLLNNNFLQILFQTESVPYLHIVCPNDMKLRLLLSHESLRLCAKFWPMTTRWPIITNAHLMIADERCYHLLHAHTWKTFGMHMYHDQTHKKYRGYQTVTPTGSWPFWFQVPISSPFWSISMPRTLTKSSFRFNTTDFQFTSIILRPWIWKVIKSFCLRQTLWVSWCGPFSCFAIKHQVLITSPYNFPCIPNSSHMYTMLPWIPPCISTVSDP